MKQCLARLLLLVFPATILLIVAGLWLARQTRFSPVILNLRDRDTRQGQVSLWDVSAGRMVSVLGYNRRGDYPPMRIGVSEAIHWRPVEFLAVRPRGTENIRLTWLPAGSGLLVSYTRDVRGLGLEALVGRQLLDLSAGLERAALIDWPFLCDRLIKNTDELLLRCPLQDNLRQTAAVYPSAVYFSLSSGHWLVELPAAARELFPLNDLLNPNWTYSPRSGLVFFGTFFDGAPGGLNRIALDSDQPVRLPLNLARLPRLLWSPDGSRLLAQQADSRVWSVFDLAQNREIARLDGADIDVNIGYRWVHDANHVAYLTLASGAEPETLHVRALDHDRDITLSITDASTFVASIQP